MTDTLQAVDAALVGLRRFVPYKQRMGADFIAGMKPDPEEYSASNWISLGDARAAVKAALTAALPVDAVSIEANACACHPETCCCQPCALVDAKEGILATGSRERMENLRRRLTAPRAEGGEPVSAWPRGYGVFDPETMRCCGQDGMYGCCGQYESKGDAK